MTLVDIVVCTILLAAFAAGFRALPRVWRNELNWANGPDDPPRTWVLGPALWRGCLRVVPVGFLMSGPLALGLIGMRVDSPIVEAVGAAGIAVVAVLMLVGGTITFFNVPKLLVAPHMRHQPGAIGEWMGEPVRPTEPPRVAAREPRPRRRGRAG